MKKGDGNEEKAMNVMLTKTGERINFNPLVELINEVNEGSLSSFVDGIDGITQYLSLKCYPKTEDDKDEYEGALYFMYNLRAALLTDNAQSINKWLGMN
jgi:hypothetical protein